MLFVLTGDIQTGKTRWLQSLTAELAAAGVACCGVLAPGVWRERSEDELAAVSALVDSAGAGSAASGCGASALESGAPASDCGAPAPLASGESLGRFEKLGIDNVLLPSGERVPFARRRDLAVAEGSFVEESQSAQAKLGWEISDAALARVNRHFAALAESLSECGGAFELGVADPAFSGSECASGCSEADAKSGCGAAPAVFGADPALLVIDELGPLELLRGGGLAQALALLERGPSERFPNALVIIRDSLLDAARERFEGTWGELKLVVPGDEARLAIETAVFGVEER